MALNLEQLILSYGLSTKSFLPFLTNNEKIQLKQLNKNINSNLFNVIDKITIRDVETIEKYGFKSAYIIALGEVLSPRINEMTTYTINDLTIFPYLKIIRISSDIKGKIIFPPYIEEIYFGTYCGKKHIDDDDEKNDIEFEIGHLKYLKRIVLPWYFNKQLDFPKSLKYIKFGLKYEYKLDLIYYTNLEEIVLPERCDTKVSFPINIIKINFGCGYQGDYELSHLINLKVVRTSTYNNKKMYLPISIEELYFRFDIFEDLDFSNLINLKIIKLFSFQDHINLKLPILPLNIESIDFGSSGDYNIDLAAYKKLKWIKLPYNDTGIINIPDGVKIDTLNNYNAIYSPKYKYCKLVGFNMPK